MKKERWWKRAACRREEREEEEAARIARELAELGEHDTFEAFAVVVGEVRAEGAES